MFALLLFAIAIGCSTVSAFVETERVPEERKGSKKCTSAVYHYGILSVGLFCEGEYAVPGTTKCNQAAHTKVCGDSSKLCNFMVDVYRAADFYNTSINREYYRGDGEKKLYKNYPVQWIMEGQKDPAYFYRLSPEHRRYKQDMLKVVDDSHVDPKYCANLIIRILDNETPIQQRLKLNNDQVRVAVGIRIGARVCEEHTCICGSTMDPYGHHALSCGKLPGRRIRHSQVNIIIHLNTAQIPSVLEPPGLSRTDGKRPDGKSLVPWKNGRSLVWDFTCSDTVAPSNVNVSAKSAGNTADLAEKRKRSKYTNLTDQYVFVPVAVESFGTWGSDGKAFVSQLGTRLKEATGKQRSAEYLFQSISMAVQRGNSINILAASGIGEILDLEDLN